MKQKLALAIAASEKGTERRGNTFLDPSEAAFPEDRPQTDRQLALLAGREAVVSRPVQVAV